MVRTETNSIRTEFNHLASLQNNKLKNTHVCRTKHVAGGSLYTSMSGSCGVCVDGVLYLFGGHHARGNTNRVSLFCIMQISYHVLVISKLLPYVCTMHISP